MGLCMGEGEEALAADPQQEIPTLEQVQVASPASSTPPSAQQDPLPESAEDRMMDETGP